MQLAMTVGAVVIGGLIVVGIVGFLFEKYADNVDSHEVDHAGSKEQDPAYNCRNPSSRTDT